MLHVLKQSECVRAHRPERNCNNVILRTSFMWHTARGLNRCDTPQAFSFIIFLHLKRGLTVTKMFTWVFLNAPHPFLFVLLFYFFSLVNISCSLSFSYSHSLVSCFSLLSIALPLIPPPSSPLFLNLSMFYSDVLQYPRLPATWLCREPDRGSSKQHGALGLRQGLQAHRKGHSCVQEDHLWLLRLGRASSRMSRWAHQPRQPFISNFSLSRFVFFWSPPLPYAQQADRQALKAPKCLSPSSISVLLAAELNPAWLRASTPCQVERKQKSILPSSVNFHFFKLLWLTRH